MRFTSFPSFLAGKFVCPDKFHEKLPFNKVVKIVRFLGHELP
jgi:hypothetical protein